MDVDGFLGNCAGTLRDGGMTIGTLGDVALGFRIFTLRDGAIMGSGCGFCTGTGALGCQICTLGDGAIMGGGCGFYTGATGGVDGFGFGMVALNRSDN